MSPLVSPGNLSASSLPPPPADLAGFPSLHLREAKLFRIHRATLSPWWFSSDGGGRFDLPAESGRGTCYLATEPEGCFLEVFRSVSLIAEQEIQVRRLSRLTVGEALLADCAAGRSREFGLTAEIHSTPDYRVPQRWAAAFATAGFDGVRYLLRHDPSQHLAGIALFGPTGSPSWMAPPPEEIGLSLLIEVERRFGLRVRPTP
ncbi:MAG TPA: RES family NAD+ phosphorylase [Thermoanaerobaculia bacterium]|nr:RES family NAD+ phosphorylase [Thermoanaerobaculia bacterium]